MWRCSNCGAEGFEPVWKTENLGFAENPYYEDEAHCPHCGSGDVEDAEAIRKVYIDMEVYSEKCRLLSGTPSEISVSVRKNWAEKEPPRDEYYERDKWYSNYKRDFVENLARYYGVREGGSPYHPKKGKFSVSMEYTEHGRIKTYTFCNIDYVTVKGIFTDMDAARFFPTIFYEHRIISNSSLGNLRKTYLLWDGYETEEGLEAELAELGFDEAEFRKEREAEYDG